jgi:hypothetical protein
MKTNLKLLKRLSVVLVLISSTVTAQTVKPDSIESKMFNNAIYGSIGISLELIGESWFTGTAYYERMFQKNAHKSNISTFVKVGYGGMVYWEGSDSYILGQYGIITGVKKHHLEASAGFVKLLDEYDIFPLSGSIGYRFQKPKGHFIFRTGVGWPEALYFGLGVSF